MSCDETTLINNGSQFSIHSYICKDSTRVPFLVGLKKVEDASNANCMFSLLLEALLSRGGIGEDDLVKKLMCFAIDGVNVFQDYRIRVTT